MISPSDVQKRRQGDNLMKEGDYRGAAKIFQELLERLDRDGQGNRWALFHALLCMGDFQKAERLADEHCKEYGADLTFSCGYVVIKYLKFKLGFLSEKDLDTALIQALQNNQFIAEYLLLLRTTDLPEMEDPHSYTFSARSEALWYAHSAKDVWRKLPGLLDWLHDTSERGGASKPDDNGKILFELLHKGMVLVDVEILKRNLEDYPQHVVESKKLTSNFDDMKGQALPGFSIPPAVNQFDPNSTISCFWDDDNKNNSYHPSEFFTSFPYS